MKQSKKTKKMLISGVVSLVLCLAMLVGSTLAWFTDTINVTADMQVGTFKVALQKYIDDEYQNIGTKEGDTTYTQSDEPVFGGTNWAPSQVEVNYLAVVNKGTMPLNYDMTVNVTGDLVGALEYAIIDGVEAGSNEALDLEDALVNWDRVKAAANGQTGDVAEGEIQAAPNGHLEIGETDYFALVIYMKEDADNSYQGKSFSADVVLNARQVNYVEVVEEPEEPTDYFADYTAVKTFDFEDSSLDGISQYISYIASNGGNKWGSIAVATERDDNDFVKLERIFTDENRPALGSNINEIRLRFEGISEPVANEDVILYTFDVKAFENSTTMTFGSYLKLSGNKIYFSNSDSMEPVEIVDLADGRWHNVAVEIDVTNQKVSYYGDGVVKTEAEGFVPSETAVGYYQMGVSANFWPATTDAEKIGDISVGIDNFKVMVPKADPFADYTVAKTFDFENSSLDGITPYISYIASNGGNKWGSIAVATESDDNDYVKLERIFTDENRPALGSNINEIRLRFEGISDPVAGEEEIVYSFDIKEFENSTTMTVGSYLKLSGSKIYFANSGAMEPVEIVDLADGGWHNVAIQTDMTNQKVTYYGDGVVKAEAEGFVPSETAVGYYQMGVSANFFPATTDAEKIGDISVGIDNFKVMVPKAEDPFADYTVAKTFDFEDSSLTGITPYISYIASNGGNKWGSIAVATESDDNDYVKLERIFTDENRPALGSNINEIRLRFEGISDPVAGEEEIVYSFDIKEFENSTTMTVGSYLKLSGSKIYFANSDAMEPVEIVDLADGEWHNVAIQTDMTNQKVTYYGDGVVKAEAEGFVPSETAVGYYQMGVSANFFPATTDAEKIGDISVGIDNFKVMVP